MNIVSKLITMMRMIMMMIKIMMIMIMIMRMMITTLIVIMSETCQIDVLDEKGSSFLAELFIKSFNNS